MKKTKLFIKLLILVTFIIGAKDIFAADYIPPVIPNYTHYNKDYYDKMVAEGKPTQETPWGFQEIYIKNAKVHNVSSIDEYIHVISFNTDGTNWVDGKTHIINFASGEYIIPNGTSYYIMKVPARTIIQGAGMGETIFKAVDEIVPGDTYHYRKLFNLEFATHDVVVRGISFYNETSDNKWGLFHSNGARDRENYLFENIEFDDSFGAIGKKPYNSNFITFRGLRKRIGNTTQRINDNFTVPVPNAYQFRSMNDDNVALAGQVGMRTGNSVVFHDCLLGDAISATIDIYNNYIEMVGISFIDPLHDHSVKCPNGNHLYLHDCTFEIRYAQSIMQDGGYWNPTFFTHEGGQLANYHFKNLEFTRVHKQITAIRETGTTITYVESEPFMIYTNRPNNISGDMVWENITFNGYSSAHQVVGYPYVQANKGFQAINYTGFVAKSAQLKSGNNNSRGAYTVTVDTRTGTSKEDITGVYSWGQKTDGSIDFPRDNRTFEGTKSAMENQPYVTMKRSTVKKIYNARLIPTDVSDITVSAINLSIYPNPVEGIMNVKSATGIRSISITTITGQQVLKENISSNKIARINTSHLNRGVYFIKVIDVNGGISTKKIIKK